MSSQQQKQKKTQEMYEGRLELFVIQGKGMPTSDRFSKKNTFVELVIGSVMKRTLTSNKGGNAPRWNDRITFKIAGVGKASMLVRIMEVGKIGGDGICSGIVDLRKVFEMEEYDAWIPLSKKDSPAGSVYIEFTFTPKGGRKRPSIVQQLKDLTIVPTTEPTPLLESRSQVMTGASAPPPPPPSQLQLQLQPQTQAQIQTQSQPLQPSTRPFLRRPLPPQLQQQQYEQQQYEQQQYEQQQYEQLHQQQRQQELQMATGEPVEYYSDYVEYAEYADGMQFYDEASSTLHYDDQVYNVYSSASTIKPLPQKPGGTYQYQYQQQQQQQQPQQQPQQSQHQYQHQHQHQYQNQHQLQHQLQHQPEYEATSYQLDSELHYDPESFDYTYENYPHSPDATYTDMYAPPEQSRVYPYNSLRGMPAYHKLLPPVPPISAPPQRPLPPPPGAYPSDLYYDLPTQPPIDPFRCYDVNTQPSAPPLLYNPDEHSNSPNSSTFSHYQHQHTSF